MIMSAYAPLTNSKYNTGKPCSTLDPGVQNICIGNSPQASYVLVIVSIMYDVVSGQSGTYQGGNMGH